MKDYVDILKNCICGTTPKWEEAVNTLVRALVAARDNKRNVYFVGNGGSAGIAVHMAADFQKTGHFRTQTFYDPSLITCLANDYGYEFVFSKPLELFAQRGDVLVAISSSGNSSNIVNAVDTAKAIGCEVITFTGFSSDNKVSSRGDYNVHVPSFSYGIVETLHNMMLQEVIDLIHEEDVRRDEM